jgi:hypothetical protein
VDSSELEPPALLEEVHLQSRSFLHEANDMATITAAIKTVLFFIWLRFSILWRKSRKKPIFTNPG